MGFGTDVACGQSWCFRVTKASRRRLGLSQTKEVSDEEQTCSNPFSAVFSGVR